MSGDGLKTALEMIGAGAAVGETAVGEQEDLFALDHDAAMPVLMPDAPRGRGRPKGARNRSTREFVELFLSRFQSPLMVLGAIYSRSPAELARELQLYKQVDVLVQDENGRISRQRCEDDQLLDLDRALAIQRSAAEAVLPYVHQRQAQAIEVKAPQRGLLVIGDLGGFAGYTGDGLPLPDEVECNQRVIDVTPDKSDGEKSDDGEKSSAINGQDDAQS